MAKQNPKPESNAHLIRVVAAFMLAALVWPLSYTIADSADLHFRTIHIVMAIGPGVDDDRIQQFAEQYPTDPFPQQL